MGVLISDNVDETQKGYTLGLEIECNCFDSVLSYMMVSHNVPFMIDDSVVTNENLYGFKQEFMRCMDVLKYFESQKYTIRVIHENNTVTVYTKELLP